MAASTSGTTCPTTGRYTTMRDSTFTIVNIYFPGLHSYAGLPG
ncbi:hypothetical protein RB202_11320 [Micrococcus yunnanensis]